MFARRPERNALLDNAQPPATADPPTPPRQDESFPLHQHQRPRPSDRSPQCYAALLVVAYFVLGVLYYSYLAAPEKFTLIDALYFTVADYNGRGVGDVNGDYNSSTRRRTSSSRRCLCCWVWVLLVLPSASSSRRSWTRGQAAS